MRLAVDRLRMFHEASTARVRAFRDRLTVAEGFAAAAAGRPASAAR